MNALVSSQRSPLYLTKPSPQWKSKTPSHHPTIFRSQNNPSTRSRLNANAKGFTSRKPPHVIKENTLDIKTTTSNEHNGSDDEELPKEVVNRVIKRILVSVGVPMALGLAFLKFFGSVREQGIWDVPVWIVFATTFLTFGTSALGIAYGALSASLDPNKKGSLLGFEEVQENWVEMWKEEDGNN